MAGIFTPSLENENIEHFNILGGSRKGDSYMGFLSSFFLHSSFPFTTDGDHFANSWNLAFAWPR